MENSIILPFWYKSMKFSLQQLPEICLSSLSIISVRLYCVLCMAESLWLRVCSSHCIHVLIVLYHGMVNMWNGLKYQLSGPEPAAAAGLLPFFCFLFFFFVICVIRSPASFFFCLDISFKQLLPLLAWLRWCRISHVCSPLHCRTDLGSVHAGNMVGSGSVL